MDYHHISDLSTNGSTESFKEWNHFNSFQHTLVYGTLVGQLNGRFGNGSLKFHLQNIRNSEDLSLLVISPGMFA